jgi:predicted transposase YdaD
MLIDMIENAKKEKEELFEKGIEKGTLEAVKNLLNFGDSIEKISKVLKVPIEKVRKIKDEMAVE